MQRHKPLKPSAWPRKRATREKAEVRPSTLKASACRMWNGKATLTVRPKAEYVRDTRYRDACRAMPCQHCGAAGEHAGVTWAHSNWQEHGKAKGIKASDQHVAALCTACHSWLDQGKGSAEEKRAMWDAAHARTVAQGRADGTWPESGLGSRDGTFEAQ